MKQLKKEFFWKKLFVKKYCDIFSSFPFYQARVAQTQTLIWSPVDYGYRIHARQSLRDCGWLPAQREQRKMATLHCYWPVHPDFVRAKDVRLFPVDLMIALVWSPLKKDCIQEGCLEASGCHGEFTG